MRSVLAVVRDGFVETAATVELDSEIIVRHEVVRRVRDRL